MPFIITNNALWDNLLAHTEYDIYHLPEYTELQAEHTKGQAIAWYSSVNGKEVIIPLVKRKICDIKKSQSGCPDLFDLQSPYGYSGLLCDGTLSSIEINELLKKYQKEANENGFISSYIRLNPFINKWNIQETAEISQCYQGKIVVLSLKDGEPPALCENHKRDIRRLKNSGFTSIINKPDTLPDFIKSYHQLMKSYKTDRFYFFSPEYFHKLLLMPGGKNILITVVSPNGEYAGAGIFSLYGQVMQYHYGSTAEQFRKMSPSKMVIDSAIEIGRHAGAAYLNLGGGFKSSNNTGLYRFKKGFNRRGIPYDYYSLRFIHSPNIYESLPKMRNDFFPSYRDH